MFLLEKVLEWVLELCVGSNGGVGDREGGVGVDKTSFCPSDKLIE